MLPAIDYVVHIDDRIQQTTMWKISKHKKGVFNTNPYAKTLRINFIHHQLLIWKLVPFGNTLENVLLKKK